MIDGDVIQSALQLPSGARFHKCALQVNPYSYRERYHKTGDYGSEDEYNRAIIEACKDHEIEVIAVTDHYRMQSGETLRAAARQAGLQVFPGFEAVAKDGVHLLCLFDPDVPSTKIERILGDCGIHDDVDDSPIGDLDTGELLERARDKWNAVCIAAHVAADGGGLLRTLRAQTRVNAWKSPYLLACSLPGRIEDAPQDVRSILKNEDPQYHRFHPVAVLNAQDVDSPEDLAKAATWCWIKMSEVTVEGLRQAFLDPQSRVRLATDPGPEEHVELAAIAWQGGFLDGQAIHFNENLNVLIGGRGTGKSTILESVRYALDLEPLGEEARRTHLGMVQQVLRSGTKISLLVCSHRPTRCDYRIERTVPNPPIVRDGQGQVLPLTPKEVVPGAEIYGQHEIAELTRSPEKLTRLLDRFADRDPDIVRRKRDLRRALERSRANILDVRRDMQDIEDRLAALPGMEETLRRFQEAGLEERLQEQSALVREEKVLDRAHQALSPVRQIVADLKQALPLDRTFVSSRALADLPGQAILGQLDADLAELSNSLVHIAEQMAQALAAADERLVAVGQQWDQRRQLVQSQYEAILRELQKTRVDGEEFMRLRRQIEELRPLRERQELLRRSLQEQGSHRSDLLAEWDDLLGQEFRLLERAAKKVNRSLQKRVRVEVSFAGDREPLADLLREEVGGRLSETIDALRRREDLSMQMLAQAMRAGSEALFQQFAIPRTQGEKLAQASQKLPMQIEELELPPTTRIELNIGAEDQDPVWRPLAELSTGQKATAVLLLLLLESNAPLLIDQPEDDLDNRFVTEGVVPKLRDEKRRRQFIYTTHNANIPVLGDAELIVGLRAVGEAGQGHAEIPIEHIGSIDARPVRELVEEILEGGEAAFEMRRLKYGF